MEAIQLDFSDISFNKKEAEKDFSAILSTCLIDNNKEYPKPPTIIGIQQENNFISLLTRKSISAIIGKAKGGKTGLSITLAASLLGAVATSPKTGFKCEQRGVVLYFDTEQGEYYGSLTLARIKELSNDVGNLRYYDLREYQPQDRLALIREAVKLETEMIALIIIDGVKDLVFDINNPQEATTIVTELMALSVQFDCHICSILHQNKGDTNARGHLGTELTNKAETVISVNKSSDDNNISIVNNEYSRGMPFDDFAIIRNDNGTPQISDILPNEKSSSKGRNPNDFDLTIHENLAKDIYKKADEYSYKDLVTQIQLSFQGIGIDFGENKAKQFVKHWENHGFIAHNGENTNKAKYLKT